MFIRNKYKLLICLVFLRTLMVPAMLTANNITVNPVLSNQTTAGQYMMVQFDISWDDSWRTSTEAKNWDAAWVFLKYREAGGEWKHAKLNYTGHTAPAGSTIDIGLWNPAIPFDTTTNPGLGAFIYRSADGTETFSLSGVQLRWNYKANDVAVNTAVDIQVFAIEMVYVPKCPFFLGSGGTEAGSFTDGLWTSGATTPLQITSESELTISQTPGNLWGTSSSGTSTIGDPGLLQAFFPKGYAAVYFMKYEIRQQDYVDFLNSLTYSQQLSRTVNPPSDPPGTNALVSKFLPSFYRNGIDIMTSGISTATPAVYACNLNINTIYSEADDGQWIACNFLAWADVAAYLDWSGLRPMTELEFEKACRGTLSPMANEYAWGTNGIAFNPYTLSNGGTINEAIASNYSLTDGNAAYILTTPLNGSINGPVRGGIFAGTSGNTGRVTAGATYYGIMEMSGNLRERPVSLGNLTGRAFTGTHGNGTLLETGNADASNWPDTNASGAGFRGGAWSGSTAALLAISNRNNASNTADNRSTVYGGRGVRLAPPIFTTPLSLELNFCVEAIDTANYWDATMDIKPDRPDYYHFQTGDPDLNLDLTTFPDYCCGPDSLTIHWQIDFTGGTPSSISGDGQPSLYSPYINFPGSVTGDVVHTITYHITDCNGYVSLPIIRYITIKPRPNVVKQ